MVYYGIYEKLAPLFSSAALHYCLSFHLWASAPETRPLAVARAADVSTVGIHENILLTLYLGWLSGDKARSSHATKDLFRLLPY